MLTDIAASKCVLFPALSKVGYSPNFLLSHVPPEDKPCAREIISMYKDMDVLLVNEEDEFSWIAVKT